MEAQFYYILTLAQDGHALATLVPFNIYQYLLGMELCEPQTQSGWFRGQKNLLPLPGIKPWLFNSPACTTYMLRFI